MNLSETKAGDKVIRIQYGAESVQTVHRTTKTQIFLLLPGSAGPVEHAYNRRHGAPVGASHSLRVYIRPLRDEDKARWATEARIADQRALLKEFAALRVTERNVAVFETYLKPFLRKIQEFDEGGRNQVFTPDVCAHDKD